MSKPNKFSGFSRSTLSGLTMAVAVMASAPACSKAPDSAKNEAKSMPSEAVDHSKMDGMKDMGGMKHMDGMSMMGNADYDFAANMRMHHQMAVDMSEAEIKNGMNPEMLQMAQDIIAAQKKEIAVLDQWLAANKKP